MAADIYLVKPQDAEYIACGQWKHGRNMVSYAEAEEIDASILSKLLNGSRYHEANHIIGFAMKNFKSSHLVISQFLTSRWCKFIKWIFMYLEAAYLFGHCKDKSVMKHWNEVYFQ